MRKNPTTRGVANFAGFSAKALEEIPLLILSWTERKKPKHIFHLGAIEVSVYSIFQGDYRWAWIARDNEGVVALGGFAEYNDRLCEILAIVQNEKRRKGGLYSAVLKGLAAFFGEIWSDFDQSQGAVGAWEKAQADFDERLGRYHLKA
jgi:hypothetical protein